MPARNPLRPPAAIADPPAARTPARMPERGRGATFNPPNRYRLDQRQPEDDGWTRDDDPPPPLATTVTIQRARTIISRNDSPDIPFDRSINPYQGCEHGCVYCYARPTHAYHDLSPGLDFESRLFAKPNAAALLRAELAQPGYACQPMALGTNTDPYQPVEREWKLTRSILEAAAEAGARHAGWVMLRLPLEVAPLFRDWLAAHYPLRAEHVMSLVRQIHGGRDYDAAFGRRQRGTGVYAQLIARRFAIACGRLGLNKDSAPLDTSRFRAPRAAAPQLDLF